MSIKVGMALMAAVAEGSVRRDRKGNYTLGHPEHNEVATELVREAVAALENANRAVPTADVIGYVAQNWGAAAGGGAAPADLVAP